MQTITITITITIQARFEFAGKYFLQDLNLWLSYNGPGSTNKFPLQDFVASSLLAFKTQDIVTLSRHFRQNVERVSKYVDAKLKTKVIRFRNVCQICRQSWINGKGKVRWDLYCRQGFTRRSTTHNPILYNFGSLTHPPHQF